MMLRVACPGDDQALARLAALDSVVPLTPPVPIAEVGGEKRAALSQSQGNRCPSWRRRLLDRANPGARATTPSAAVRGATSQPNR